LILLKFMGHIYKVVIHCKVIFTNICIYLVIYVGCMTTHANPYGAVTMCVVSANMWLVTCCGFLVYLFLFTLFFSLHPAHTSGPTLMISVSYDMFPCKKMPFGGCDETAPHLGGHIPQNPHFGAWIGIFKPNSQNIKTCILSKLLHRFEPNFAC